MTNTTLPKLPYGLSNFHKLISEGHWYVDRTNYIAQLEAHGSYHVLMRPRRFGKSLFLSMLEHYYDQLRKPEFDALFGQLHVGRNPTPLANAYQVLVLDFSGIDTSRGQDILLQGFARKVEHGALFFLQRYGYPDALQQAIQQQTMPQGKLEVLLRHTALNGQKLLLLIDEYDHFANSLLAEDLDAFRSAVGKGGFVRSFYETIKSATQAGTMDRFFITGVTAIMLDSLTSGFNIAENLTFEEDFHDILGFTREETSALIRPLVEGCKLDAEAVMEDVTHWYNGYRFHRRCHTIYNSDMVLYFAKKFDRKACAYPDRMLDENIASDYGKLMALFAIGDREDNYRVLEALVTEGEVVAQQQRRFDLDKTFGRDDFISLLAYVGFASLVSAQSDRMRYAIPNHVIRELYFQYFLVELERRNQLVLPMHELADALYALSGSNNIEPLRAQLERVLRHLSNRDSIRMDEKHLKVILITLLFQTSVWFLQSEPEVNRRYPDVLLRERSPFELAGQHLIELKYAKKQDGEAGWEAKRQEGLEQIAAYRALPEIAAMAKLHCWLMLTDGERVEVMEGVRAHANAIATSVAPTAD
ncbi:AAA family ATPase [Candidatus Symbiobacter mobilis]|uniref:AAA-ATPase-like domain-containing protein n=1 Tax=Candidatus Symbiobacter mobilis CR TaxID=946483 RepID=U5NB80_9BURK|nr:AAA family ATPase [Candidatus Symbiobacter mobilis]AGX88677.1 hypothetical protein Cenrod_2627 [Candidatus Symbiobacter mobilis CR]